MMFSVPFPCGCDTHFTLYGLIYYVSALANHPACPKHGREHLVVCLKDIRIKDSTITCSECSAEKTTSYASGS